MSTGQQAARASEALRVAVLGGGRSSEHEVSLASAASVRGALAAAGHDVLEVEIARDGAWRHAGAELELHPGRGLLGADVAFPALHGPYGEDGVVQGLLESLGVAYVGAGVAASAVCMDKVLFKQLMAHAGLPQVAHMGIRAGRFASEPAAVLSELGALGLPVFVKPAHLGSSVGIAKVSEAAGLRDALADAFAHDELVIVEAMAAGLEVECGVLGSLEPGRPPFSSEPGEIVFSSDWYDFEAKYTPGGMELVVPARISVAARERVRELALRAFEASGCEGLARADFFVDGESVLLNELNTMPGFTPTSVYARLIEASGVGYGELLQRLCLLAIARRERHEQLRH